VYHDRTPPAPRRRGWLSGLFGSSDEIAPAEALALPQPNPEQLPVEREPLADLVALAEQLAALIEGAQDKLDGAVDLVDRSADEAAAYGRALADDADSIGAAGLPVAMVDALLELTRTMIERTQAAEARLRATNDELRGLQDDLTEAQFCAERDPLTGLPNRRALEAALRRAVATASATNSALSLAFCDIDQFKRLNDIHGHQVGDRVLRLVADCLSEGAGDDVFVGRQGGEEFVMLFEGKAAIEAAAQVDAIRAGLAGRSLRSRSDGTPIGTVTFSAGVSGYRQGDQEDDLLQRADAALYRAKGGGRNQVVIDTGD
jgi:diguanylate cyclase